jgi:hypothetical protein
MAVASLVISILALTVSASALVWQMVNYLLTGQRAKVLVTGMNLLDLAAREKMEPVAQITVLAVGRVPVEVTSWSLSYPGDQHLLSTVVAMQYGQFNGVHLGDSLPMVIEPGRSGNFNVPIAAVAAARDKLGLHPNRGRLSVHFAARRSIKVSKPIGDLIRLPPDSGSDQ